jgi:hypothetical protein
MIVQVEHREDGACVVKVDGVIVSGSHEVPRFLKAAWQAGKLGEQFILDDNAIDPAEGYPGR